MSRKYNLKLLLYQCGLLASIRVDWVVAKPVVTGTSYLPVTITDRIPSTNYESKYYMLAGRPSQPTRAPQVDCSRSGQCEHSVGDREESLNSKRFVLTNPCQTRVVCIQDFLFALSVEDLLVCPENSSWFCRVND